MRISVGVFAGITSGVFAASLLAAWLGFSALRFPVPPAFAHLGQAWTYLLTEQPNGSITWLPLRILPELREELGRHWTVLMVSRMVGVPNAENGDPVVIEFVDDDTIASTFPLAKGRTPELGELACIGRWNGPSELKLKGITLALTGYAPRDLLRLAPGPAVDAWCPVRLVPRFFAVAGVASTTGIQDLPLFQVFALGPDDPKAIAAVAAGLVAPPRFQGRPQLLHGWHSQPTQALRAQRTLLQLAAVLGLLGALVVAVVVFLSATELREQRSKFQLLRAVGADLRFMLTPHLTIALLILVTALVCCFALMDPLGRLLLQHAAANNIADPLALSAPTIAVAIAACALLPLVRLAIAGWIAHRVGAAFVLTPTRRGLPSKLGAWPGLIVASLCTVALALLLYALPQIMRPGFSEYGLSPPPNAIVGNAKVTNFMQINRLQRELGARSDAHIGLLDIPLGVTGSNTLGALSSVAVAKCVAESATIGINPAAASLLGIRLISGTYPNAKGKISLSESAAKRCFPDHPAIGGVLQSGAGAMQIVAIHADTDLSLGLGQPLGEAIVPFGSASLNTVVVLPNAADTAPLESMLAQSGLSLSWRWQPLTRLADERFASRVGSARVLAALAGLLLVLALVSQLAYVRLTLAKIHDGLRVLKAVGTDFRFVLTHATGNAAMMAVLGSLVGAAACASLSALAGISFNPTTLALAAILALVLLAATVSAELARRWTQLFQ